MPLNICHFASAFKLLLKLVIHYQNTGNKKRFFLFAKSLIIIANVSLEFFTTQRGVYNFVRPLESCSIQLINKNNALSKCIETGKLNIFVNLSSIFYDNSFVMSKIPILLFKICKSH